MDPRKDGVFVSNREEGSLSLDLAAMAVLLSWRGWVADKDMALPLVSLALFFSFVLGNSELVGG